MYLMNIFNLWLIILSLVSQVTGDINLAPQASWSQTGVTVAGWSNATSGSTISQLDRPIGISITSNDIMYVSDSNNHRIIVVNLNSNDNISIIGSGPGNNSNQFNTPNDLFVTNTSLYVLDYRNHRVQKTSLNCSNSSITTILSGLNSAYYLYVDNDDNIYLSNSVNHNVLFFRSNSTSSTTVAGTGVMGANNSQLNTPYGIFLNQNGTIFIADRNNHRIMKWFPGATNGIIAAGDGTNGSSSSQLYYPTQIIVDSNEYMYISESGNVRIIRWAPNSNIGVCIVACTGIRGTAPTQLHNPRSLTFDSQGSLYVTDGNNNRVQKFQIIHYNNPSYNQPKFASCATWNPNAITFANSATVGTTPEGIYIDINNTVYVANKQNSRVLVWLEGNTTVARIISGTLNKPFAVFASIDGDIYVDNGDVNRRVDKWSRNAINSVVVMNTTSKCFSLFVDINNTLYCSNDLKHKVVKLSLNSNSSTILIAAGNGIQGSQPHMLSYPNGIFVDMKFNLYVADCWNHRIQRFEPDQQNGTTIAGSTAPGTITLNRPYAVIVDADQYLFITDSYNRIIRSGPFGFQCLFGCTMVAGPALNQLDHPHALSFDNHGNIFVADRNNNRIQKFFLATNSCVPSYNQPKLSSCATWNPNATTIANQSIVGTNPFDVFVDIHNTIYVPNSLNGSIQVWLEGSTIPTRTISGGINTPASIFVTTNGDIYIDNGFSNHRIDKWTSNTTASVVAMYVDTICYGLFISIDDYLYCSMDSHKVVKTSLNNSTNTSVIVAGNGTAVLSSYTLQWPRGIFVDMNLNLYVADCLNHRIQLFQSGQLNGTTIIINGSNGIFTLNRPAHVVLDIDGYLFIVDTWNNRILGSGPTGFRCIVGCTGSAGTASDQLDKPHSLSFDSHGNLFVMEYGNNRLQKFFLSSNSCEESSTYDTQSTASSLFTIETTVNIISYLNGSQSSSSFFPTTCLPSTYIGSSCNISTLSCDILQPCLNNATCINNNSTVLGGYTCSCPSGFNGTECQYDNRLCQSNTCWNNGTCDETWNRTFICQCSLGWEGTQCETKVNYCEHITCLNGGLCQSLLLNYTCRCLGDSYSGQYCEVTSNKINILKIFSRSFAYIVIIAIISVAIFVGTLDVLKYFFGIDPVDPIHKKLGSKKRRKPISIIRYIYVHGPLQQSSETTILPVAETKV